MTDPTPDAKTPHLAIHASLRTGLQEMRAGWIEYLHPDPVKIVLATPEFRSQGFPDLRKWYLSSQSRPLADSPSQPGGHVLYQERPTIPLAKTGPHSVREPSPVWIVGMTGPFRRRVELMDRTLQGRVLLVIRELCGAPMPPHSSTCGPLEGEWKDLWAFTSGDYRLIYYPDLSQKRVTLLAFEEDEE